MRSGLRPYGGLEHPGPRAPAGPAECGAGPQGRPKGDSGPGEGHPARPPVGPWPRNSLRKSWPGAGGGVGGSCVLAASQSGNLKVLFSGSPISLHWTSSLAAVLGLRTSM